MLRNTRDVNDTRDMLLSILSNSGTLAGINLALVGILNLNPTSSRLETITDDLFLFSALGFVLVCYLVFFAIRQLQSPDASYWTKLIDYLFLASLTLQIIAGFLTVYTFV